MAKTVKLYYIGGFTAEKPRVTAKGNFYVVPPAGGYLEVPDYIARDLIRRNRTPQGISVFETNKKVVDAIMNRDQVAPTMAAPKYSKEELLQMLAEAEENLVEDVRSSSRKNKEKVVEGEAA